MSEGLLHAAGHDVLAGIDQVPAAVGADHDEVIELDLEHRIVGQRRRRAGGEIADRQAVGPRADVQTELVHGGSTAGAWHIAQDDRGLAGNVFLQVPLIDPRLGIGIAADAVVDQDGQDLALVELGRGRLRHPGERGGDEQSRRSQHSRNPPVWAFSLLSQQIRPRQRGLKRPLAMARS